MSEWSRHYGAPKRRKLFFFLTMGERGNTRFLKNCVFLVTVWRSTKDRRKLPRSLYRRKRIRLQRIHFPPDHPQFHVPRWWFYKPQRHWRKIHLREKIRRRKLHPEAHWTWYYVHGQCRSWYQWLPVLHYHC